MSREDTTHLLERIRHSPEAVGPLFERFYEELRSSAARMSHRSGLSDPTALVHEAFVKVASRGRLDARDRAHLKAILSRVLRHVMVDEARRRGRSPSSEDLADIPSPDVPGPVPALVLDELLERLKERDPVASEVAGCRVFAGMTMVEISAHLGIPLRSIERSWRFARAWLHKELSEKSS